MRIIDFHAHVGKLIMHLPEQLDQPDQSSYEPVSWRPAWVDGPYCPRRNRPFLGPDRLTPADTQEPCERLDLATVTNLARHSLPYGISMSVLQPIEPVRPTAEVLARVADYKARWRELLSGCWSVHKASRENGLPAAARELIDNASPPLELISFCSVHPLDPDKETKLKDYIRQGARGLKLHPIIQNLAPERPEWSEIFETWRGTARPVLVHAGVSGLRGPRSQRDAFGEAARYEGWIRDFSDIPFVLAHMNLMNYELVWELAHRYDNVLADLSFHGPAKIREARKRMGSERLLFASDFPYNFPKLSVKAGLDATRGDPDFRRKFFYDNAARLIGLE